MSIEIPNALLAFGSVKGADGTEVSGAGATPARSAKGVYTLTLDQPVDSTECAVLVTARGATTGYAGVAQTSDAVKTVSMLDAAGAAQDTDFDYLVLRAPG